MIPYYIISTGSKGNAVVVNKTVLIDCGVPYAYIKSFAGGLKLVLLTHIHGDHFKPSTLSRLSEERPGLRFACCQWLLEPLEKAGVPRRQIDVLDAGRLYSYGICEVMPVRLTHDVPNCGYKLRFPEGRVFYATDTATLDGIEAPGYDLYMVEANYEDEEVKRRIADKKLDGRYAYELRAIQNHLSKAQCDDFIYGNIGPAGEYVYLHQHHEDKEE